MVVTNTFFVLKKFLINVFSLKNFLKINKRGEEYKHYALYVIR
jgi:hypothetical protein